MFDPLLPTTVSKATVKAKNSIVSFDPFVYTLGQVRKLRGLRNWYAFKPFSFETKQKHFIVSRNPKIVSLYKLYFIYVLKLSNLTFFKTVPDSTFHHDIRGLVLMFTLGFWLCSSAKYLVLSILDRLTKREFQWASLTYISYISRFLFISASRGSTTRWSCQTQTLPLYWLGVTHTRGGFMVLFDLLPPTRRLWFQPSLHRPTKIIQHFHGFWRIWRFALNQYFKCHCRCLSIFECQSRNTQWVGLQWTGAPDLGLQYGFPGVHHDHRDL